MLALSFRATINSIRYKGRSAVARRTCLARPLSFDRRLMAGSVASLGLRHRNSLFHPSAGLGRGLSTFAALFAVSSFLASRQRRGECLTNGGSERPYQASGSAVIRRNCGFAWVRFEGGRLCRASQTASTSMVSECRLTLIFETRNANRQMIAQFKRIRTSLRRNGPGVQGGS